MIKSATSATMFGWTNENGVLNFTATELPAAALDFLINGDYMINLDSTYNNFEMRISLKGADNGKVKFNVSYSTGWSWSTVEGTLSDDGTYISAYVYYSDIQIYANAENDYYYKLVAVKKSSAAAKYLGTFTVNETEKVSIALGATSSEDEDGELDGLDASCFKVTYKGKTVKASTKYSSSVSEIEFTVDGKTYVAKLVDGAMTVTEKAAA
ncbi:unknown [Acidiphilium sp. CAG:727]|nr:unknown [Acidiphilium sp. CAG:727]